MRSKVVLEADFFVRIKDEIIVYVPDGWDERTVKEEFCLAINFSKDIEQAVIELGMLGVDCSQLLHLNGSGLRRVIGLDMNVKDLDGLWEENMPINRIEKEDIAVGNKYRMRLGQKKIEFKITLMKDELIYARNQKGKMMRFRVENFITLYNLYGTGITKANEKVK